MQFAAVANSRVERKQQSTGISRRKTALLNAFVHSWQAFQRLEYCLAA
jgi:hypothetical protein